MNTNQHSTGGTGMNPRVNYEMTESDMNELLEACRPTPAIKVGNYIPSGPQENANRAWQRLGEKMGFDYMTVRPIPGKGERFFTAVPSETDEQRDARLAREAEEKRQDEIQQLDEEIKQRQIRLDYLRTHTPDTNP